VEWESLIVRIVPILAFLVCITIVAELADGLGSRHWRAVPHDWPRAQSWDCGCSLLQSPSPQLRCFPLTQPQC
jgi:hypothetical protein